MTINSSQTAQYTEYIITERKQTELSSMGRIGVERNYFHNPYHGTTADIKLTCGGHPRREGTEQVIHRLLQKSLPCLIKQVGILSAYIGRENHAD